MSAKCTDNLDEEIKELHEQIDPDVLKVLKKINFFKGTLFTVEFVNSIVMAKEQLYKFKLENKSVDYRPEYICKLIGISEHQFIMATEYLLAEGKFVINEGKIEVIGGN